MDIKFNIYYSSHPNGPWTLSNNTPIDIEDGVMSHFVDNLDPRTNYYIRIIGGYVSGSDFLPLQTQAIGPYNEGTKLNMVVDKTGQLAPYSIEVATNSAKSFSENGLHSVFDVV